MSFGHSVRFLAAVAAAVAALSALGGLLRLLFSLPASEVTLLAALVGEVGGLAYAGRLGVHLRSEYWYKRPGRIRDQTTRLARGRLNRLVILDALAVIAWIGQASWLLVDRVPWIQACTSFGLAVGVLWLASETVNVAESLGLRSGSDVLPHCPIVKSIVTVLDRIPIFRGLNRLWGRHTKIGRVSALVVLLSILPLVTTVADAPASSREIDGHCLQPILE